MKRPNTVRSDLFAQLIYRTQYNCVGCIHACAAIWLRSRTFHSWTNSICTKDQTIGQRAPGIHLHPCTLVGTSQRQVHAWDSFREVILEHFKTRSEQTAELETKRSTASHTGVFAYRNRKKTTYHTIFKAAHPQASELHEN